MVQFHLLDLSCGQNSIRRAVETLLDHLVSPPILGYPDFSNSFVLHIDASQEGLGAVLYQKQDGKIRVIGYGSRSLTKAEKNSSS